MAIPFRLHLRTAAITLLAAGALLAAGGVAVMYAGWYDVSAMRQHFPIVHTMFDTGLRASVRRHARDIKVPTFSSPELVRRGAVVYHRACAHCHGGPGVAPMDWGKAMQPVPGSLVDAGRRWKTRELYWLTRYGIRMSGMPAWEYHLSEGELWAVVAFVQQLPRLSARGYRELSATGASSGGADERPVAADYRGDPVRGRIAVTQYACHSCHIVPGVIGAKTYIGGPLAGLGERKLLAGRVPNTHANLVRWLMDPQAIDPDTAMPNMGVNERDARDIAAFLLQP
jgi:mono/diheme cytochrome c family protein